MALIGRRYLCIVVAFISVVLCYLIVVILTTAPGWNPLIADRISVTDGGSRRNSLDLIYQRNELSKMLNYKQKIIGQLECEKITNRPKASSSTGGYCQNSSRTPDQGGRHMIDKKIIPALSELFSGKTVASFGDGPGIYKTLLLDTGKLQSYDAYDGAPYVEITSEGRVVYLDLTLPQYGLPIYDWILSLEVAEHIPEQHEKQFIDNIARHAKEGVVLSWAVPGQGGHLHVNLRPFEYVLALMTHVGFRHDPAESEKLRKAASFSWLRKNTNVCDSQVLTLRV